MASWPDASVAAEWAGPSLAWRRVGGWRQELRREWQRLRQAGIEVTEEQPRDASVRLNAGRCGGVVAGCAAEQTTCARKVRKYSLYLLKQSWSKAGLMIEWGCPRAGQDKFWEFTWRDRHEPFQIPICKLLRKRRSLLPVVMRGQRVGCFELTMMQGGRVSWCLLPELLAFCTAVAGHMLARAGMSPFRFTRKNVFQTNGASCGRQLSFQSVTKLCFGVDLRHLWAALVVQTRALGGSGENLTLCPGIDLCNHVSVGQTARVKIQEHAVELVAEYSMEAGQEVTINYGPDADFLDLFEAFGFFDSLLCCVGVAVVFEHSSCCRCCMLPRFSSFLKT